MDYSLPGSPLHGTLQGRILEWVAIPFARGSSWPRDQTQVSQIAGKFFTIWATREALRQAGNPPNLIDSNSSDLYLPLHLVVLQEELGLYWNAWSNQSPFRCRSKGVTSNLHRSHWVESEVVQSCPTLCDPMDCSLPDSSIQEISQTRILEWVAISFSRRSSQPRDWTQVSRIVGRCFTIWATRDILNATYH